jgi:O-antigen ligase
MKNRDAAQKIARFCIPLLAFLIPSGFYFLVLPVAVIVAVCRIVGGDYRLKRSQVRQPVVFFPILFYGYLVAEFFFSHRSGDAASSLSEKLPFLLFPLVIGTSTVFDKALSARSLNAFVLSICLAMVAAIGYAAWDTIVTHRNTIQVGASFHNKFTWYGLTRLFNNWHPTYVSVFCNLAIAILLSGPEGAKRSTTANNPAPANGRPWSSRHAAAALLAFCLLSCSIFLLYSITGILIYCCLLLFFGYKWLLRWKLSRMLNLGLVALTIGVLAGLLYFNPMRLGKIDKLREKGWKATDLEGETNVLTIRLAKWSAYVEVLQKHYVLGATPGDIREDRQKVYEDKGYKDLALHNYNAHNEYLEVLATFGLAGFVIFCCLLMAPLNRISDNPLILPFMIIALIAFATESILERQQGILFFFFFYSLLTATTAISRPVRKNLLNLTP